MKKILFIIFIIIFIPTIIVHIFIRDDEIKFIYTKNMNIRVLKSNGIIEELPFENYIVGVLAGEMPIDFNIEALKAQAVAARSYAMKKIAYNRNKDYDVVDTVYNQVYLDENYLKNAWKSNYTNNINKIKKAVLSTSGEYLVYNNEIIEAFYFSTSVGKTENSEDVFNSSAPYLRSVSSTWDTNSPVYMNYYTFSKKDFLKKLNLKDANNINIKVLSTTSTGRIKKININNRVFTGTEVQSLLKLKSNYFNIKITDKVYITTKGYGHGVGMSQYGAEGMAKKGYKYDEILKHYYSGVEIKKIV